MSTLENLKLLRLDDILKIIPISRSSWIRGVNDGRYPSGIKLSKRTVVWKESEIISLIESM